MYVCNAARYTNLFKLKCTYIFKTNADCTYISSSKENVHRNVEEIGELFPLKRLCTAKHRSPLNRTYKLQRLWHAAELETNILQRNLSFGVKMFAELFKRKLRRIPSIKKNKNGLRTMV